jgi:hypothetical protein
METARCEETTMLLKKRCRLSSSGHVLHICKACAEVILNQKLDDCAFCT